MIEKNLNKYFVDLHVHIGRNERALPVKVTASRNLTFANIARECQVKKGIDIVGIVDCASPRVIEDIEKMLNLGEMEELLDGGLRYHDVVTIILGAEIECKEKKGGLSHQIAYFPYFANVVKFSKIMNKLITNLNLSSQNSRIPAQDFFNIVDNLDGIVIPAHVFTPYKSVFGSCTARLEEIFSPSTLKKIPALELGLSADTFLADCLPELSDFTFLTNSDAHSLSKIAREYNTILMEKPSYKELLVALKRESGRKVVENYGLNPKLGKYNRSFCNECKTKTLEPPPVSYCKECGSKKITKGVLDRIIELSNGRDSFSPTHRPPYYYQIALDFVPGIGKKTREELFYHFGTEMNILHKTTFHDLSRIVGPKIATDIILARKSELLLIPGGGGKYGKVSKQP